MSSTKSRRVPRESEPEFIIKPRRQFADEETTAKFKASCDGNPTPEVIWSRDNGGVIEKSEKYTLYERNDFHFLEINNVEQDDKGTYVCTIRNKLGESTMKADLEVYAKPLSRRKKTQPEPEPVKTKNPPVLIRGVESVDAEDGKPASLECVAKALPEAKVVWKHNGSVVEAADGIMQTYDGHTARINFTEVYPDDAGIWECVISNQDGEISSSGNLNVIIPETTEPLILVRSLVDQTVLDGSKAQLDFQVKGALPDSAISWTKDGASIQGSSDFQATFNGSISALIIREIYPEDEGLYTCTISGTNGTVSTSCQLTVQDADQKVLPAPAIKPKKSSSKKNESQKPSLPKVPPPSSPAQQSPPRPKYETSGPPVFATPLKDTEAVVGKSFELLVDVNGSGPMEVCWLLGKEDIRPGTKGYEMKSDRGRHTLVIKKVEKKHAGIWFCEAYNDDGDDDCECRLTVTAAPPGKEDPSEAESAAKGAPPAVAAKTKRASFGGANTPISGKEKLDSADYRSESVSANSSLPHTHAHGDIDHVDDDDDDDCDEDVFAPEFIRRPKSTYVDEGSSVIISCEIQADPPPTVYWEKDGQRLENSDRLKMRVDGDIYSLELQHTLVTDAGRYVVIATNSEGTEKSSASLNVKELENSEVTDFRSILKSRPGSRSMTPSGSQPVGGEQRDFRGVLSRSEDSQPPSSRPTSRNLTSSGPVGGEQHDFRTVLTRHVKTKERPRILQDLTDLRITEGRPATLECKISGVPKPRISWYIGKKEIKESRYFKMTFDGDIAKLVIAEVYSEDEGEYTCLARNDAGSAQSSCDVTVREPGYGDQSHRERNNNDVIDDADEMEVPVIESLVPENLHVLRGKSCQLRAQFQGIPTPQVRWLRDKIELKSGGNVKIDVVRDTSTLTLTDATPGDSGRYSIVVVNAMGSDATSSSITVEDKPDPPQGCPEASNIGSTSLTLCWYGPSFDGGSKVTEYRVEACNIAEGRWRALTSDCKTMTYEVPNLKPGGKYLFRISAANKHGFSQPSKESVTITMLTHSSTPTSPRPPAEQPVSVKPGGKFEDFYDLEDEIGKGRFGSVHKCVQKATGREMAVKFIKTKMADRETTKMELEVMNCLQHPKLLRLLDAFETRREVIIVTELVGGGELFERIVNDDYELTERECVYFMKQICEAVKYMHSCFVLHLDLKPENILCITPNSNEIKIIDFGLARKHDPNSNIKVMYGTPEFVAPEVVNYDAVGFPTDMWSVGVICYILISGLSPFAGSQDSETLSNVTMATWDFEDDTFDDVSAEVKDFITKLLVKRSRRRMTAQECLEHSWLSQGASAKSARRLSTEKHKRFLARRKWQKMTNAVVALNRLVQQPSLNQLVKSKSNSITLAESAHKNMISRFIDTERSRSNSVPIIPSRNDANGESETKSDDHSYSVSNKPSSTEEQSYSTSSLPSRCANASPLGLDTGNTIDDVTTISSDISDMTSDGESQEKFRLYEKDINMNTNHATATNNAPIDHQSSLDEYPESGERKKSVTSIVLKKPMEVELSQSRTNITHQVSPRLQHQSALDVEESTNKRSSMHFEIGLNEAASGRPDKDESFQQYEPVYAKVKTTSATKEDDDKRQVSRSRLTNAKSLNNEGFRNKLAAFNSQDEGAGFSSRSSTKPFSPRGAARGSVSDKLKKFSTSHEEAPRMKSPSKRGESGRLGIIKSRFQSSGADTSPPRRTTNVVSQNVSISHENSPDGSSSRDKSPESASESFSSESAKIPNLDTVLNREEINIKNESSKKADQSQDLRSRRRGVVKTGLENELVNPVTDSSSAFVPESSAPTFLQPLVDEDVEKWDTVQFIVKVKGHPEPSVTWMKNGVHLQDSRKFSILEPEPLEGATCHTVIVRRVGKLDAAEYTCVIENSSGRSECSALLSIH